jgi:hypothetical protein
MVNSSSTASRNGEVVVCGGDVVFRLDDVDLKQRSGVAAASKKRAPRTGPLFFASFASFASFAFFAGTLWNLRRGYSFSKKSQAEQEM